MTIFDVAKILDGSIITDAGRGDDQIKTIVASDLMSDVLASPETYEKILLVTSLVSIQILNTAQMVDAVAVVVHNNKALPCNMQDTAMRVGVALIKSPLSKYDCCVRLYEAIKAENK